MPQVGLAGKGGRNSPSRQAVGFLGIKYNKATVGGPKMAVATIHAIWERPRFLAMRRAT